MQVIESLNLWRYWLYRAYLTHQLRYRGSKLGRGWTVLSVFVVVIAIGTIWGIILNRDDLLAYYLYLFCGYPIWSTISGTIDEACDRVQAKTAGGIPYFVLILEKCARVYIPLAYILPFVFLGTILANGAITAIQLFLPFVLVLLVLWSVGATMAIIALLSLVPDLKHLIKACMRLAFLATPIIWEVERLGVHQGLIWFNPFYVPLEAVRSVLMGRFTEEPVGLLMIFAIEGLVLMGIGGVALKKRLVNVVT